MQPIGPHQHVSMMVLPGGCVAGDTPLLLREAGAVRIELDRSWGKRACQQP